MRRSLFLGILLLAPAVLGNPSTYVFKNVTAITLSNDTPLENATVLVRGEEITDVTTDETEPPLSLIHI